MAGNTTLDPSTPGIAFRVHNYVNIGTEYAGYFFHKSLENLNYIAVDCIGKPAFDRFPEWTYNNSVVDSIKTNRELSFTLVKASGVVLFILFVWWLHAKKPDDIIPKDPAKNPDPSNPAKKPDESIPDTNGKGPEGTEVPAKAANGADPLVHLSDDKKASDANGSKPPLIHLSDDEEVSEKEKDAKADSSSKKESKAALNPNPSGSPDSSDPFGDLDADNIFGSKSGAEKPPTASGLTPGKLASSSSSSPPPTAASPSSATGASRGFPTKSPLIIPAYRARPPATSKDGKAPSSISNPSGSFWDHDIDAPPISETAGGSPSISLNPKSGEAPSKSTFFTPPHADPVLDAAMEAFLVEMGADPLTPTGAKSPTPPPVIEGEKTAPKEKKD